ncbi:MAG: ATP-binding protein [Bdellovibrionia bacterium]
MTENQTVTGEFENEVKPQESPLWMSQEKNAGLLFQSIVNTVREPLVVLDHQHRVQLANRSFYQTFRVLSQDTINQCIYELGNHQWDIPALRHLLDRIIPEKMVFDDFEVNHEFPIIGQKTMLLNARRINGDPMSHLILLAFEDITERKRLEKERDDALKAREELVAVVSHEIKNPLTTITSSLDLIKRLLPSFDGRVQVDKLLNHIRGASERMTRITSDLLEVTKIEAGRLPIEKIKVEVANLIEEVVVLFRPLAEMKSIRLEKKVSPNAHWVLCDRDRIIQVLSNLIDNAIKFTAEGGIIQIEVQPMEGQIEFQVTDTGCGIPPDQIHHVFERFWQAKHKQYLGSGLGLYIVKKLVEAHGGVIGIRSQMGHGSTFFFSLSSPEMASEELEKKTA